MIEGNGENGKEKLRRESLESRETIDAQLRRLEISIHHETAVLTAAIRAIHDDIRDLRATVGMEHTRFFDLLLELRKYVQALVQPKPRRRRSA